MNGGWIGVDLDGTLAEHVGTAFVDAIGKPIPAMLARVHSWLQESRDVRIFTARVAACGQTSEQGIADDDAFAAQQRGLIDRWCLTHLCRTLPITATKDFDMVELWDDRAVQVIPNTGECAQDFFARVERERLDRAASEQTHINCEQCGVGRRYLVARLAEEKAKSARLSELVSK